MRPALLNPLFADVSSLPGVGAGVAKALARLKIARVVDMLFHLPVMKLERVPLAVLDPMWADKVVSVPVLILAHDVGQGRTPTRVRAADDKGTPLSLVYFADRGGWARKQLPQGTRRVVSGRLELFGDRLQIVHPDVAVPEEASSLAVSEPVYRLTEGIANKRMRAIAAAAMTRAPQLEEWIEPSVLARQGWAPWQASLARAHADPDDARAKARLGYDELLADQLALLLVRQSVRRTRGRALPGTGNLTTRFDATLPYRLTGAQERSSGEIAGDMAQACRCCGCCRAMSARVRPWWRSARCWPRSKAVRRPRCSPPPTCWAGSTWRPPSACWRHWDCASDIYRAGRRVLLGSACWTAWRRVRSTC